MILHRFKQKNMDFVFWVKKKYINGIFVFSDRTARVRCRDWNINCGRCYLLDNCELILKFIPQWPDISDLA